MPGGGVETDGRGRSSWQRAALTETESRGLWLSECTQVRDGLAAQSADVIAPKHTFTLSAGGAG